MKIGIIETGNVSDVLKAQFGGYLSIFHALIRSQMPDAEFVDVSVINGDILGNPQDADAWLITGSRHSVYEDLPWITATKAFVRACMDTGVPIVGICFGHQLLAEALGGKVEKSTRGWGVGVQEFKTKNLPDWMAALGDSYRLNTVYQDQVATPPPGARVIAGSEFCPVGAMVFGDPDHPSALSVQAHPEITPAFLQGLIDTRLTGIVPQDRLDTAQANLATPIDSQKWHALIATFLRMAKPTE